MLHISQIGNIHDYLTEWKLNVYNENMENSTAEQPRTRQFRVCDLASLPNRVRRYRTMRGFSVQQCAGAIGVTRQAIYKAELHDKGLSADNWLLLADFLGCDLRVLKSPL